MINSQKILSSIKEIPFSYPIWIASFLAIILARLFSEYWMEGFSQRSLQFLFYEFSHTFLFFLFAYILFLAVLKKFFRSDLKITALLLLYGFLITLFPSIFDHFYPVQGKFYDPQGLWQQYTTFFSNSPHITVTHGARIEIALVVVSLMILAYVIKRKIVPTLFLGIIAYTIFFLLGTIASWTTILIEGFPSSLHLVHALDVAQRFLSPAHFFTYSLNDVITSFNAKMSLIFCTLLLITIPTLSLIYFRKKTLALCLNMRFPQLMYHGGLFLLGTLLAVTFAQASFSLSFFNILTFIITISSIFFAWFTTVIVNDIYDKKIDVISNANRPLIQNIFTLKQYKMLGWTFFGLSLYLGALISFTNLLLLIGYQTLAWLYSAWPYRLKRFPLIATLLSAFASIFILLIGFFLLSGSTDISPIPTQIFVLLILTYTCALPVKDIKDIKGDKKDGVYTIPVLFGEYKGRIIIGTGIFFSYLLSVWILNEPRLWLWAFLFGIVSYILVTTNHTWKHFHIKGRHLPFFVLFLVLIYGIIMIATFLV